MIRRCVDLALISLFALESLIFISSLTAYGSVGLYV